MRAPAFAAGAAVALIPMLVAAAILDRSETADSWKAACRDWSTTRFVLTATCRDGNGSEHTSGLNLLACAEPRAIAVTEGRLTCTQSVPPVAGPWADRCHAGRIVDDGGEPRLVAFCRAVDLDYLAPQSLRLSDCAEPVASVAGGQLICANGRRLAVSGR